MRSERRVFALLIAVLVIAVAASALLTFLGDRRRSAEATATIVSALYQPGGGTKDHREEGFHLRYIYAVQGVDYPGIAFRTWSDVDAHHPKVCYDPANPPDHLLVDGDTDCG